jgi:hypothetical protein
MNIMPTRQEYMSEIIEYPTATNIQQLHYLATKVQNIRDNNLLLVIAAILNLRAI